MWNCITGRHTPSKNSEEYPPASGGMFSSLLDDSLIIALVTQHTSSSDETPCDQDIEDKFRAKFLIDIKTHEGW